MWRKQAKENWWAKHFPAKNHFVTLTQLFESQNLWLFLDEMFYWSLYLDFTLKMQFGGPIKRLFISFLAREKRIKIFYAFYAD